MARLSFGRAHSTSVVAIAHSQSGLMRAEGLLAGLRAVSIVGPAVGVRELLRLARGTIASSTRTLYLVDIGRSTALAALLGRLSGKRVIVDTGDACFALARSVGDRSFLGLLVVGGFEALTLRCAHEVVVRGSDHLPLIRGMATCLPDLPPSNARPVPSARLRADLELDGRFVVGLVGSLNLSRRRGTSYGWDLIEALRHTSNEVVALVVGDGTGLEWLRRKAREMGVDGRCCFVGRVHGNELYEYISAMDVAISTQTNDVVGQVRTTGKLPLYLACGCPVIASHVGEAARLLGPLGWTLPYRGVVDPDYPRRLAGAIEAMRQDSEGEEARREQALGLARDCFDPQEMRDRLRLILERQR